MIDEELVRTFEQLETELLQVEGKLFQRYLPSTGLHGIRQFLLDLDLQNRLEEDELVQEWHQLYSNYKAYES